MSIRDQQDVEPHDDDEHAPQPKQKRHPYAQLPHYVLSHPDLSPGDRELYAHLDAFWRNKNVCWPSQQTLAQRMGVKNVCTVHRRAKRLEKAELIKVVRQGLKKPNKYVKLPPPQPKLRVVPDLDDADLAEVQAPELASVHGLDLAAMQYKADAVEADAREEDKGETTAGTGPLDAAPVRPGSPSDQALKDEERHRVIRCMEAELLPVLRDLHEQKGLPFDPATGITLARLIEKSPLLHEGHIRHMADRYCGEDAMPDRRYGVFDVDAIRNPAAHAYAVLRSSRYQRQLPHFYVAMRGTWAA